MSTKDLLRPQSRKQPAAHVATPYNAAGEEWKHLVGGPLRQAHSWRLAFFGLLAVCALVVGGLVWQSSKATVVPYLIEHDTVTGEHRTLGPVAETSTYVPKVNEVRRDLSDWVSNVRSVPLDPVVVKRNWQRAYAFTRQSAAASLTVWANSEPRLQAVGRETVEVQVTAITPIQNSMSYQARWHEVIRGPEGAIKEQANWTATVTLDEFKAPRDDYGLSVNPLGIYIKSYQWTRDS
jgi:type IV secretion system protein TrbF